MLSLVCADIYSSAAAGTVMISVKGTRDAALTVVVPMTQNG
jgi:hypothetical protein